MAKSTGTLLTSDMADTKRGFENHLQYVIDIVNEIPLPATRAAVAPPALGNSARAQLRLMRACLDARAALF